MSVLPSQPYFLGKYYFDIKNEKITTDLISFSEDELNWINGKNDKYKINLNEFFLGLTQSYAETYSQSCVLTLPYNEFYMEELKIKNIKHDTTNDKKYISFNDLNLLEFLSFIFTDTDHQSFFDILEKDQKLHFIYNLFLKLAYNVDQHLMFLDLQSYASNPVCKEIPILKYKKNDEKAVAPFKTHFSDVGWDLTLIKFVKKVTDNTYMYDTGISVKPPPGYYTAVHPRSSLSKSGYILANCRGTIDPAYTGNLYVALTKTNPDSPDITLPFVGVQLELKPVYYAKLEKVDELDETARGSGGFGSTSVKNEKE